jgi:hypothetical protein
MLRGILCTRNNTSECAVCIFTLHIVYWSVSKACVTCLCNRVQQLFRLRTASRNGRCWGGVPAWPLSHMNLVTPFCWHSSQQPSPPTIRSHPPSIDRSCPFWPPGRGQASSTVYCLLCTRYCVVDQQCPCTTLLCTIALGGLDSGLCKQFVAKNPKRQAES